MRKAAPWLLALVTPLALAASVTLNLNGKASQLEGYAEGGKLYVAASPLAKALGATVSVDTKAKKAAFKLAARSFTANATIRNNLSYVVGLEVARGLGLTASVAGTTLSVSRPATAPAATPPPAPVQGTTQLAGGEGAIGQTYTLGKDAPLNFTLRSAEYTVARVHMNEHVYAPKADEKLLVLRYTVQNPTQSEQNLSYSSFKFTVVDAKDVNHAFDSYIAREGTSEVLNFQLKPAQKVDVYAVWPVPAAGVTPKLIVERESGAPVLRYDLRGKVKGLAAPFADPADASGATARAEVPAQAGTYYPLGVFDAKLESVAYSGGPMDGNPPEEGKRYLVATFAIKNATGSAAGYGYSQFAAELRDADGERVKFDGYLIKASRDEPAQGELKPGEEYRFRVYFQLPQDVAGKTLSLAEGESRAYAFDVSSAR